MQATFYKNFGKLNNSTKIPEGITGDTLNILLKDNTSVKNPVMLLNTKEVNYTYCLFDGHFYHVTDVTRVSNDQVLYSWQRDPMASYRNYIINSNQYVVRSASEHDGSLIDNMYPIRQSKSVIVKSFSFIADMFNQAVGNPTGFYVLGVIGNTVSNASGSVSYYAVTKAELKAFLNYLFSSISWANISAEDLAISLQKALFNPFQYVVSCNFFPFKGTMTGVNTTIKFGYWDSGVNGLLLSEADRVKRVDDDVTVDNHPQIARGIYTNGNPFTRHTLHCYSFGSIPLDTSYIINSRNIKTRIYVDFYTGEGTLYVYAGNDKILMRSCMFGIPIQMAQTSSNLKNLSGALVNTGTGFLGGNILGVASGIVSVAETLQPPVEVIGNAGALTAFYEVPFIESEYFRIADDDPVQKGRPLCSYKALNTLSGYTVCSDADIAAPCTYEEKQTIISYMNSGFYLE